MKRTRFVLVISVLTIAFTAVGQQRGRRGFGGPDVVAEVRDALNLAPQQVDKVRALLDSRRQADQAAQNSIQEKIDALATVQEKSPSNADAVAAASQALRQAEQA